MENVPPEDWPTVLANLRDAARPGGVLYLTVEELTDRSVEPCISFIAAEEIAALAR